VFESHNPLREQRYSAVGKPFVTLFFYTYVESEGAILCSLYVVAFEPIIASFLRNY
jgi:hypothetical protein